jgi:putative sigma-54 modulation protein
MDIHVRARRTAVTPEINAYANEKIQRAVRIIDGPATQVEIELFAETNPSIQNSQVAEVTVFTKGPTIRVREAATDMHAAIDLVSDKLERRIKKYRGKIIDKHTQQVPHRPAERVEMGEPEEPMPSIVKTKSTNIKPMSTEEAIMQMELLGHDFFVYMTEDTEDINILYKRRDGDYGVISPQR